MNVSHRNERRMLWLRLNKTLGLIRSVIHLTFVF